MKKEELDKPIIRNIEKFFMIYDNSVIQELASWKDFNRKEIIFIPGYRFSSIARNFSRFYEREENQQILMKILQERNS